MANPRQRRKARSSTHKPVKTSRNPKSLKKHPPIRGPKVLQDAWDDHKTVRQNYATLGLAHSLTPRDSDGREASGSVDGAARHESAGSSGRGGRTEGGGGAGGHGEIGEAQADDTGGSGGGAERIRRGFGRIVRDKEGKVVRVELGEEDEEESRASEEKESSEARMNVQPRHLMEARDEIGQPERITLGGEWVQARGRRSTGEENEVIQALEKRAEEGAGVTKPRSASDAEVKYLRALVRAHGDDVDKMARDRLRNPMQYTAGRLRRAIRSAGGYERLGLGQP